MIPPDGAQDRSPAADDLALVQRIADCDAQALSALYDRHSQAIYAHAFHLLGDVAEGEDAVEETFWRVWRTAGEFDQSLPNVATWLLMMCRQRATERLRGSRKRSLDHVLEDTTGLGSSTASEPGDAASLERARTGAALAAIPLDQRTVLELAFFRGIAPADAAAVIKLSPETARTRLRVAMRKLRDGLGEAVPPLAPDAAGGPT